jgi:hypothetical protein
MPATILSDNGASSGTAGLKTSGSNDGILELQTTTSGGTATAAITIDTAQRSKFPTTIGVGGATPSTSGSGISFPATVSASSDVNTLDDYEEGTWTPTYFGESSAGTTTYSSQLGVYTKIGNLVVASGVVVVDTATGTGNIRIGGFPFTSANNNQCVSVAHVSNYNWSAGTFLILELAQNATTANIYGCADDAQNTLQQVTNESQLFRWTCSYRV